MIYMLDHGYSVDPRLIGSRETLSRRKDQVRSRVASARKRVNGLFVNKKKEMQLENQIINGNISDESETVVPD